MLPDSSTYCFTYYNVNNEFIGYDISVLDPKNTIEIDGEIYTLMSYETYNFFIKQVNNKLIGLFPYWDNLLQKNILKTHLIMDFDAAIGDTIHDLYLFQHLSYEYYYAIMKNKDSTLLSNGTYHHFVELEAYGYTNPSIRYIKWEEKGLCGHNSGILFSIEDGSLVYRQNSFYCTTDTLYANFAYNANYCDNCDVIRPIMSVNNVIENEKITIYPNPTNDVLFIHTENAFNKKIKLYNLQGQLLLNTESNSSFTSIPIHYLNKGYYSIVIEVNGNEIRKPFLVN